MEHLAIDLGASQSQVCIRSSDGQILQEIRHATGSLSRLLAKRPTSRVILETSSEAFRIADQALACGHEVRVVPATLVKSLGVGARGIKNDRRDAQVLSEVSCRIDLPSVHVPSELSRQLKSICSSRDALVRSRTKLVNNVRGWLRTQLWRVRSGSPATFAERVRNHARVLGEPVPEHVNAVLRVLEVLTLEIAAANRQIRKLASEHDVCRRLMTVPGVGPVTAVRFVATLDEHGRFGSAHAVQSYLGLTPGEHASATRHHRTGITKAGSCHVRWVLVQAAWSAIRTRPQDPMVRWATRIAHRRGRFVAAVALSRKIAGILYALWRDGSVYDPQRGAAPDLLT